MDRAGHNDKREKKRLLRKEGGGQKPTSYRDDGGQSEARRARPAPPAVFASVFLFRFQTFL